MQISIIRFGLITALLAVIMGAFGAHVLKEKIDQGALEIWNKGIEYQFIHAFAFLFTGLLSTHFQEKLLNWSAALFFAGIVMFSGSLYILAIRSLFTFDVSWVGPITPIGGMTLIGGWVTLIMAVNRKNRKV